MGKSISKDFADGLLQMAAHIMIIQTWRETGVMPDCVEMTELAREWFRSYCDTEEIEFVDDE